MRRSVAGAGRSDLRRDSWRTAGWALAALGPVGVATALVPLRTEIDNTNLALVLVVVVVLAAMAGGPAPGAAAAVVATLSYDFFLTKPYLTLTIRSPDDLETTMLLLVIGLLVGQLVVAAQRLRHQAARGAEELARLRRVAHQIATGASREALVRTVTSELTGLLALQDCVFEPSPPSPLPVLPRLERNGSVSGVSVWRFVGEDLALPIDGVELPVLGRGREVGRFILVPEPDASASLEERVVAVALSDQLGAVLASESSPLTPQEA